MEKKEKIEILKRELEKFEQQKTTYDVLVATIRAEIEQLKREIYKDGNE